MMFECLCGVYAKKSSVCFRHASFFEFLNFVYAKIFEMWSLMFVGDKNVNPITPSPDEHQQCLARGGDYLSIFRPEKVKSSGTTSCKRLKARFFADIWFFLPSISDQHKNGARAGRAFIRQFCQPTLNQLSDYILCDVSLIFCLAEPLFDFYFLRALNNDFCFAMPFFARSNIRSRIFFCYQEREHVFWLLLCFLAAAMLMD